MFLKCPNIQVTDPSLFTNREIHPQISGVPNFNGKEVSSYIAHFLSTLK